MTFDEETEQAIDEYVEEQSEAQREHDLIFWEGCTVVTAPTGAPPEYITVEVDGVNDPNTLWRGVPGGLIIGDEVLVYENPISHRREIVGSSGATGATTPFVHDHSSAVEGGDDLNPQTVSQRTLVVGVGCPYTTLGAAVAAVPGVPCTIRLMGITTVEAGAVTVPADVAVVGMGEGSVIGMGANTLTMSDDSYLQDVVVTHTSTRAIDCNNADCELFNVKIIITNAISSIGVDITGDSAARLHHVVVESTTAPAVGIAAFNASGTATPLLFNCEATDTTNITNGLNLVGGATCIVTTKYCHFAGAGNDVAAGASTTWNSYKDQLDPLNCTLAGTVAMLDADAGDSYAFTVENTSGGAVAAGAVGYIDEAGEFKTTATAYSDLNWAVAVFGGPNNADIWVARRGRVTVTLNGNCNVGDYLYTSTTAGQAQPQSYTRPELFAVALTANAAGAGGTCEALLLCHTKFVPMTATVYLQYVSLADASDYRATIAGLPGGAVVNMNAPISGNINTIDPQAANYLAKFRIYNETDGDYALLDDVTGAAQLTLTAAVPAGWAVGETLTARSQTCVNPAAPPYFYDLDLSDADNTVVPVLARAIAIGDVGIADTGAGNITHWVHPWTAYASSRLLSIRNQVANFWNFRFMAVPLYQRRYCVYADASGGGTVRWQHNLSGWWEAAP